MPLHIEQISLTGFRCYDSLRLEGLGNLVVLVGPNAVGKTNIIEALQLLTSGSSFRKPSWQELVCWGGDACAISARFTEGPRDVVHEMRIAGGQRSFAVNGKKKSAQALRGMRPSVLFIPDDLQMVKAASTKRRDTLDALALQLSPQYSVLKSEYAKTLKQRNLLLRDSLAAGPLFDSWNDSLVVHGSRLYTNRYRLFTRLAAHMRAIYAKIVPGEEFAVEYIPSWNRFDAAGRQLSDVPDAADLQPVEDMDLAAVQGEMAAALQRLQLVEQQRKSSLVGPHKDEVAFFINGKNARLYASQGQQRTVVLVEKLAEVELVREILGEEPVLLLDDVMSELDSAHRSALTWFIEQSAQTFITTTNLGYFSDDLLQKAQIIELPVK